MASAALHTFLMLGTTSSSTTTWSKIVDISSYPDIKSAPEDIDVSDLTHKHHLSVPGWFDDANMDFEAWFTPDDYQTVKALEGDEQDLAIWFGGTESGGTVTPTGSLGKFSFKGFVTVTLGGAGVDGARPMGIHINRTSDTAEDFSGT